MNRENKNPEIAALHREKILSAAQELFGTKGYLQTTIDDISCAAGYSRRTIYAYYSGKDDLLHAIIANGLELLRDNIADAVHADCDFHARFRLACSAMRDYKRSCPQSADAVSRAHPAGEESAAVRRIFSLGTEINLLLENFLIVGQRSGDVRREIIPALSVQVLWAGISSLIDIADSKNEYICRKFSITTEQFLDYGFTQLMNSVLEARL